MKYPLATAICFSAIYAATAAAQTNPGLMLAPFPEGEQVQVKSSGIFQDTESSNGNDVDFTIVDFAGRVRLDPDSSYDPTLGFTYTHFELDSGDAALPEHLVDTSVAFGGRINNVDLGDADNFLGGTWQMGYTLGVGYAGSAPFNDGDAWYAKGSFFGVLPYDRDSRLVLALEYDGNRVFLPDVPLPAITYFDRLNEKTTYGIGFPFSNLTWKPTDQWTVRLTSFVFVGATARIGYTPTDKLELFAEYDSRSDAFQLADDDGSRRLIFEQQRVETGVGYQLCENAKLTASIGYAFGQEFDRGYDIRDTTSVVDLDDAFFFRLGVSLDF